MNRRIEPDVLLTTTPHAEYRDLVSALNGLELYGQTPLCLAYTAMAKAVESRRQHRRKVWAATTSLLRIVGHRLGLTDEFESKVGPNGEVELEHAEWIIGTLVHYADRRRYNKTDVDACKVLGQALAGLHGIESIPWVDHYKYAAPPNMGRRVPTPH